jgi:hypothetical protein
MKASASKRVVLGLAVGLGALMLMTLALGLRFKQSARAASLDVCPTCTYTAIQDAINAAEDGDTIRVAAGTYTGTMVGDGYTATVIITKDISLLGGYSPAGFDERDPGAYNTVIDGRAQPDRSVVVLTGATSAAIDGFVITGSDGAEGGGGIWVDGESAPTISNNRIQYNRVTSVGGGILVLGPASATIGGNVVLSNTSVDCGGGLWVWGASTVIVSSNHFLSNSAASCGGGLFARIVNTGTIIGNTFSGNTAPFGGGLDLAEGSFDVFSNTIADNRAQFFGGGVLVLGADTRAVLVGNTVVRNVGQGWGGGMAIAWGPRAVVQSNQVISNTSHDWIGSGLAVVSAEVLVESNVVAHNVNDLGSLQGNGAIGISMGGTSQPVTVTNNVVVDNADKGIFASSGVFDLSIVNNTVAQNRNEGVVAWGAVSVTLLRNNIITASGGCAVVVGEGAEFRAIDHNNVGSPSYCAYGGAGDPPASGPGDIFSDPSFVDPAGGDYHLRANSPCIGAGSPVGAPRSDSEGMVRDARPEMGAYEWGRARVFMPLALTP